MTPLITHVGQVMVTRHGKQAIAVDGPGENGVWTFFHVWEYETKDCLSDGRCAESNIFDIIGPWVEPETVDLWVNLDGDGASSSESSRDRAEAIAADDRTHLYHITGPADAPDFKVVWTAEGGEQDG